MSGVSVRETFDTAISATYDVIVAGGGASGLIAAVAAARLGARTLLLERQGCLGGTATTAYVAQYVGFYNGDTQAVWGIPYELVGRIMQAGGSDGFGTYTMAEAAANPLTIHHFPFNPEIVKIVADEMVAEAGVHLVLHSQVVAVVREGKTVKGVIVETISGRKAYAARVVIDATGDAVVAHGAGVEMQEDTGEGGRRQPNTLCFRLSNVDVKRFRALPRETKRALALEGIENGELFWQSMSFCSTPGGTDAICLMSRILGKDSLERRGCLRAGAHRPRADQEHRRLSQAAGAGVRERHSGGDRAARRGARDAPHPRAAHADRGRDPGRDEVRGCDRAGLRADGHPRTERHRHRAQHAAGAVRDPDALPGAARRRGADRDGQGHLGHARGERRRAAHGHRHGARTRRRRDGGDVDRRGELDAVDPGGHSAGQAARAGRGAQRPGGEQVHCGQDRGQGIGARGVADIATRTEVAGSVWKIVTEVGQKVEPGDTIMIVELMKMEIPVVSEEGGTVRQFLVEEKAAVSEGQVVAILSR